jgi:hypothetical protein
MPVAGICLPAWTNAVAWHRVQTWVIGQMVTNRDFAGALAAHRRASVRLPRSRDTVGTVVMGSVAIGAAATLASALLHQSVCVTAVRRRHC